MERLQIDYKEVKSFGKGVDVRNSDQRTHAVTTHTISTHILLHTHTHMKGKEKRKEKKTSCEYVE